METLLQKLYYDPSTGFRSKDDLYKKAKKINSKITRKVVDEFVKKQPLYENFKTIKSKPKYPPIYGAVGQYQADLTFLPAYRKANNASGILTAIEINSKKGFAVKILRKDMVSVANAIKELIEQIESEGSKINVLQTDKGKEFLNQQVKRVLRDAFIEHRTSDVKTEMGVVERFNRTLKVYLKKWFALKNTTKWVEVLPSFIVNYNSSVHSATGKAPDDISEEEEAEIILDKIRKTLDIADGYSYSEGDMVKIRRSRKVFGKENSTLLPDLYVVVKRNRLSAIVKKADGTGEEKKVKLYNIMFSQAGELPQTRSRDVDAVEEAQRQNRGLRILRAEPGLRHLGRNL